MIHVLGGGNIGSLTAVALSQRHAVELLLKPSNLKKYKAIGETLRIHTPDVGGALWQAHVPATSRELVSKPISKMVVTLKAFAVARVLADYAPLLNADSEVLLLHNGMGVAEELRQLWPKNEAPRLSFGVTDAGVKQVPPFGSFAYTGNGVLRVSGQGELLTTLENLSGLLVTERLNEEEFFRAQHEKLVVNAVVNPLTAILSCPNGSLLSLDRHNLIPRLVKESCRVLGLDASRMLDLVRDVLVKTAGNTSSMLADVEQGRPSEVDYINGYIVRRARAAGIGAPLNKLLRDLVLMRTKQTRHELETFIPLELD